MTRDVEHALATASRRRGLAVEPVWPRVTRRGIQIALGMIWTLDGMAQFQPAMFTNKFATQVIAPTAVGQPTFVSGPV